MHWTSTFLSLALCAAGCDASLDVATDTRAAALSGTCPDLVHEGNIEIYGPDEIDGLAGITEITGSLYIGDLVGPTFDGFPCLRTVSDSVMRPRRRSHSHHPTCSMTPTALPVAGGARRHPSTAPNTTTSGACPSPMITDCSRSCASKASSPA
jgi:hypothetical protein